MKTTQFIWIGLGLAALALSSCNKEESRVAMSDEVSSESILDMVERAVEEPVDALTLRGGGGADCGEGGMPWPDCVEITDSGEGVYPRTIVVDFGEDCYTPNGMQRTGIIEIELTGDVRNEEGAMRTVTFNDLSFGSNMTVNGTRQLTNSGQNEDGLWTFAQETSMEVNRPNMNIARTYTGMRIWLAGHDTEACGDDVWQRDGEGQKIVTNGFGQPGSVSVSYAAVVYDRPCGYPVSGTVTMVRNLFERILNFGDGTCDALAELTINGTTHLFDLDTHEIIE
jgi:hypothetical protein